jgi:hypothetical protein
MIICFEAVFNRVLGNSKTHLIVKLGTFPHLRRARAGFGGGRGAVRPPRNTRRRPLSLGIVILMMMVRKDMMNRLWRNRLELW